MVKFYAIAAGWLVFAFLLAWAAMRYERFVHDRDDHA